MDDYKDEKDVDDDAPQSNLWREFLKEAVAGGRGQQNVGHLVVFGATNSGKSTLVSHFGKLESRFNEMKRFLMMRYAYCHITASDSEDTYSLLNIWQIAEPSHADVLEVVIPKEDMPRVAYVICLDLSRPSGVEQEFNKWMECVTRIQDKLLLRCDATQQDALKLKLSRLIQTWVDPKDDTAQMPVDDDHDDEDEDDDDDDEDDEEKDDEKVGDSSNKTGGNTYGTEEQVIDRNTPSKNIGAPIIVVANKCDVFRSKFQAEADAEDHFEIICSYIRWWCIEYGAASFSMAKGLKDQARRILSYIDHRIFDSKFERSPHAVVKLSNLNEQFLFIPSGFDNKETIKLQNPNRNLEETPFNDFFRKKEKKKVGKPQLAGKPKMNSDENEKFLRTVLFDLQNGDRSGVRGARSGAGTSGVSGASASAASGANGATNAGADGAAGNGVNISDFFQRLLDPAQQANANT